MPELSNDEELKRIYESASTIAVVGAHPDSEKPAHYVPAYLQERGYRILPINPGYEGQELWGEPVRATLTELEEAVDVVDFSAAARPFRTTSTRFWQWNRGPQ